MRAVITIIVCTLLLNSFGFATNDQNITKFLQQIDKKSHKNLSIKKLAAVLKTKPVSKDIKFNKNLQEGNKDILTVMYLYSMSVGKQSLEQFMDQSAKVMNKFNDIRFYAVIQNIPKIDFVKYLNTMYKPEYSKFDMKMQPYVFKDLNITKVPAFLFSKCPARFKWKACKNIYIVRGDITLDKALEVVSDVNATFKKYERVIY